jgi:hypothetical protein
MQRDNGTLVAVSGRFGVRCLSVSRREEFEVLAIFAALGVVALALYLLDRCRPQPEPRPR